MKKIIISLLLVGLSFQIFSQEKEIPIHVGFKVGTTFSNLSPDYTDANSKSYDFRIKQSINFGFRLFVKAGKNLLIVPEYNYVRKGAIPHTTPDNGPTYYGSYGETKVFQELNLNLAIKIPSNQGNILFGVGPSFCLAFDDYSEEFLSKTDFGLNVLVAYQLPIGFSFELNFNKGIKKQIRTDYYTKENHELTTNYFGFCIAYLF